MVSAVSFSVIAFAVATNLDNLWIGFSYGITGMRVSALANMIIAAMSAFATGIALGAGGMFSQMLSTWGTRILGAVLLSLIGIWMIGKTLIEEMTTNTAYSVRINSLNLVISILKEPARADTDHSGVIDVGESVVLGIALALNCIASGIAAGLMRFPFMLTTFAVACLSYLTVLAGWYLGSKAGACWLGKKAGFLAGLILIIVSFCQLKA